MQNTQTPPLSDIIFPNQVTGTRNSIPESSNTFRKWMYRRSYNITSNEIRAKIKNINTTPLTPADMPAEINKKE